MIRALLTLIAVGTFTACALGPDVETFRPAHQAAGIDAVLELQSGTSLRGELLAVEGTGLVVLNGNEVTRVPYVRIRTGRFHQSGITIGSAPPAAADREKLRLLSRFPQGLSETLLQSLLRAYGQDAIAVVPSS